MLAKWLKIGRNPRFSFVKVNVEKNCVGPFIGACAYTPDTWPMRLYLRCAYMRGKGVYIFSLPRMYMIYWQNGNTDIVETFTELGGGIYILSLPRMFMIYWQNGNTDTAETFTELGGGMMGLCIVSESK